MTSGTSPWSAPWPWCTGVIIRVSCDTLVTNLVCAIGGSDKEHWLLRMTAPSCLIGLNLVSRWQEDVEPTDLVISAVMTTSMGATWSAAAVHSTIDNSANPAAHSSPDCRRA